jgi:hypothetical protein
MLGVEPGFLDPLHVRFDQRLGGLDHFLDMPAGDRVVARRDVLLATHVADVRAKRLQADLAAIHLNQRLLHILFRTVVLQPLLGSVLVIDLVMARDPPAQGAFAGLDTLDLVLALLNRDLAQFNIGALRIVEKLLGCDRHGGVSRLLQTCRRMIRERVRRPLDYRKRSFLSQSIVSGSWPHRRPAHWS